MSTAPAVFLDRDGVLNAAVVIDGRPHPPRDAGEMRLLPGVEGACARLREAGFILVCITNQPDIARGATTAAIVAEINGRLQRELALDAVAVCPHDDADGCACRKPRPGLILEAAAHLGVDLTRSVVVGDRWRDVEAGRRAGCRTVLLDRAYDEPMAIADAVAGSLDEAVPLIIALSREGAAGSPAAG
ncbi:MAG: HAD family hydrolase [Candidatus Dormibacteria bacterium]